MQHFPTHHRVDDGRMRTPPFDDSLLPLDSEARIEERVSALIGRAARRQIWFLFVDEYDAQLPLLLPIEDHPSRPDDDDVDRFAILLDQLAETSDARGTIVVIERFADAALTRSDLAWAAAMQEASARSSVTLRGILLSHSSGVRWIAPDDYLAFRTRAEPRRAPQ